MEVWVEPDVVVVVKPGDIATFNISLFSNVSDTYYLSVESLPEDWVAKFYYQNMEISSIKVGENKTVSIKMIVSISSDTPLGEYTIYFVIESSATYYYEEIPLTVKVRSPERRVTISAVNPYLVGEVGETLTYYLTITNNGEKDENLLLRASPPGGWNCRFLFQGKSVEGLYVRAGSSQQITVEFTPDESVKEGSFSFIVTVFSGDYAVSSSATLYATTLPRSRDIRISTVTPYLSAKSGEIMRYRLTITNAGDVNETLLLKVVVPDGWRARLLTSQGESILKLYLGAGRSQEIIAEFTPLNEQWTGEFSFIILVFSDDGAISESITLHVNLLPRERSIKIMPLYSEISVEQGQLFSVPVTITNEGECDEQLILNADLPEGWNGFFKTSSDSSVKVNNVYLASGGSKTIIFEAAPTWLPSLGEHIFTIKVSSVDGLVRSVYDLKVNVEKSSRSVLSCQLPSKIIQPGSLASFQVRLANPTSFDQTFKILIKNLPSGWKNYIKTAEGEMVSLVNVAGGSSVTLRVEISASTNVQDGVYDIILLAESSEISENITLYIEVQSPSVEVKLKAIPPYLDVYSGSKAKFKIQVSNTGGKDNLLNVTSLGLPEEFKVKFEDSGGGEITAIYVEAGATKEFFVAVSVPENIKLGARKFTISIFNAEVEEKVDLTLNVLGLYRIAITNTNFYTTLNVGGEGTFTLSVKNTGSMEVTSVRVESVSVPEGFTIKMSPESIPSLKTNEERSFVITISSDPNVNAGNYYMNFNVLSDQTEKLSFSLRVEVFQTTNWLLYAGIGIIIALVFLVLIYRKFGRR
ncbi:MAG: NEW3 domain-containing protein [Candidatus Bathyarchaeia archaeon]